MSHRFALSRTEGDGITLLIDRPRTTLTEVSEPDLARRAMSGERAESTAAEEEICRRFAPRIRLYGFKHLRDRDSVEELAQRVLLIVLRALRDRTLRQPEGFVSFVLGTARLQTLEMNRGLAREPLATAEQSAALALEARSDPEPMALTRLARCLERLPERERSVVVLSFLQEESSQEIASSFATTTQNVRVIRHRAVARLRDCIDGKEVES